MITETDRLARALDAAGQLWPEARSEKSLLLRKILESGMAAVESAATARRQARLAAIEKVAGSMSDVWPEGWREELKAEWPA